MTLKQKVQIFLKANRKTNKPLLLGFSGGEDSLALAHCLHTLKETIHLAHFDHSWRSVSGAEALFLKQWAKQHEIPFYMAKGKGDETTELAARLERYDFFNTLFAKCDFEALVLAHHRDDQIETVLKRILEGAQLTSLKGMRPLSQRNQFTLFRPLLEVSKDEIRAYLCEHRLTPILDKTNADPAYLRARMRQVLIPYLQKEFGKEILPSFIRLGDYSAELENYLEHKLKNLNPIEGPFGVLWDFSSSHRIEVRFALSRWFKPLKISLTHKVFEAIFLALETKKANYRVEFSGQTLIIDRGNLFIVNDLNLFTWRIEIKKEGLEQKGWKSWWQGKILVKLPKGTYGLAKPTPRARKHYNNRQIPAFLRDTLPVLVRDGEVVGDFFEGIWKNNKMQEVHLVEITCVFLRHGALQDPQREAELGEKSKIMLP